jgi:hypothetical protein
MANFTREELEAKTAKELKRMCVYELDLPGLTKKAKDIVVDAILLKQEEEAEAAPAEIAPAAPEAPASAPLSGVGFTGHSVITKPDAEFGGRASTTIQVSCGASSGAFPVVGRTVKEVGEFLREVLNVDRLSTGLVNGNEVDGDYVLTQNDTLEFLKPAGKKG